MKNTATARKKRILFLITKGNWGGAQRYVYDLATRLPKDTYAAMVAMGEGSILAERLAPQDIPVHRIHSLTRDISLLNDLHSFFEIYRLLKKGRPDVLHINSSKAGGLGALAARLAGVPRIVFTVHGWAFNEPRSFIARQLILYMQWLTVLLSDAVITVSRHDFIQGQRMLFAKKKMYLVHNGIETTSLLSRDDARAQLGIPSHDENMWIGTIAELHPNKDLRSLVCACASPRVRGKIRCITIGDGEERTALGAYVKECGVEDIVTFAGKMDNAAQLLSAFDIFVLPSVKEGLPYVLLEAGFAGLPTVATRVGGIPEIVDDGISGILVPPRSPEAIAEALAVLIENKEKAAQYGAALKKKVVEEFSLERMVQKTMEIYGGAVDKKL